MTGAQMLGPLKRLVKPLVPYRVRVLLRARLTPRGERYAPDDVERVKAVTAKQWESLARRSDRYLAGYWDHADDVDRRSQSSRRSEWLAALPVFAGATSALELGCGAGRNLYFLEQRYPHMALYGIDINPDGIEHARRHVRGGFRVGDLYEAGSLLAGTLVDVIFTMGVLIHLHPRTLPELIRAMARSARRHLVFVEEISENDELVKGPAWWRPTRRMTGDYIQWSPNLPRILTGLGLPFDLSNVPADLQSNGARDLVVTRLRESGQ